MSVVTLDDIRAQLRARPIWHHALAVVDTIEAKMAECPIYRKDVELWLSGLDCYSTVWFRDMVMEPLRHLPHIVEIGKQFNPTTEWHNTWMPLDSAAHRAKHGVDPEEW